MKLFQSLFLAFLLLIQLDTSGCRTLRRWIQRKISWSFADPYKLLTPKQFQGVRSTVREAFGKWAVALEDLVEFEELNSVAEEADISVYFAKKNHSCYEEFDGKGGVVAHSMYPPFGVLHLDGDEEWHTRKNREEEEEEEKGSRFIDLRLVLVHEIGHTLGLRHSRRKKSVMKKHYEKPSKSNKIKLSKYDVRAIRELYGSKRDKI